MNEHGEKPVFDRAALVERLGMDDEGLIRELMEMFLADLPVQIQQLKQALEQEDGDRVMRLGHSLKGAAANLGTDALSDVAHRLEIAGRNGDLQSGRSLVPLIEREHQSLLSALFTSGILVPGTERAHL